MKRTCLCILLPTLLLLSACNGKATHVPEIEPVTQANPAVVAEGNLKPDPSVELSFAQPGILAEVLVEEGDLVMEGQIIARLENSETLKAEVSLAEVAYIKAEQVFNLAKGAALRNLADAHETLRKAQLAFDDFDIPADLRRMTTREALQHTYSELEEARTNFEPYKYLEERLERDMQNDDPRNPKVYRDTARIYKKRLDDAWADYRKAIQWSELEANVETAKANMENTREEYDNLSAGEDAEQMAVARAQYESALANLNAARAALANSQLRAPFAATVLSLDLSVGESVNAGVPVAYLGSINNWKVETKDLAEIDVANVAVGDAAVINLDAFPGEEFTASVAEIDPVGKLYLGDMTYQITLSLDEADPRFLWNMTATVTVDTAGK